ncbi:MAG TPA: type II secretion system protein GspC [Kofleriaceae bacterium]|jgi:general secretion pathway protein C
MTGALSIIACSAFAAKAAGHVAEASLLVDAARSPPVTPVTKPVLLPRTQDKDPAAFVERNMFCSTCARVVAKADTPTSSSMLALRLLATEIGTSDETTFATIVNTENQAQGAYAVGDELRGVGTIAAISYQHVDVETNGHVERLQLLQAAAQEPKVAEKPAADLDDAAAAVAAGIKKIDATSFEIDRNLIDQVAANPMAFAKGGRAIPTDKGIRISGVRTGSAFATLGLTNGDTLAAINNVSLTTADGAMNAFTKLREATSLELEIVRHGQPMTLKYRVR